MVEKLWEVSCVHQKKTNANKRIYPPEKVTPGCAVSVISSSSGETSTKIRSKNGPWTLLAFIDHFHRSLLVGVKASGKLLRLWIGSLVAPFKAMMVVDKTFWAFILRIRPSVSISGFAELRSSSALASHSLSLHVRIVFHIVNLHGKEKCSLDSSSKTGIRRECASIPRTSSREETCPFWPYAGTVRQFKLA